MNIKQQSVILLFIFMKYQKKTLERNLIGRTNKINRIGHNTDNLMTTQDFKNIKAMVLE